MGFLTCWTDSSKEICLFKIPANSLCCVYMYIYMVHSLCAATLVPLHHVRSQYGLDEVYAKESTSAQLLCCLSIKGDRAGEQMCDSGSCASQEN